MELVAAYGWLVALIRLAVGVLLVWTAVYDARTRTIPNRIPALLCLIALVQAVSALAVGSGFLSVWLQELLTRLVMAGLLMATLVVLARLGLGGGDIKLFCALELVMGPAQTLMLIAGSALLLLLWSATERLVFARTHSTFAFAPFIAGAYGVLLAVDAYALVVGAI